MSVITRFAPSPTGALHLGNLRTALFNFLYARRQPDGQFLLRIEDTDALRSREEFVAALLEDLSWLGLHWDSGPFRQSERAPFYAAELGRLQQQGAIYPCFCSARELELSRRARLAAGAPPRYAGTCRELPEKEIAARRAAGQTPAMRFRVPGQRRIEFDDFVHGPQVFQSQDLGDFIVQRADGVPAFFFCNAVDDSDLQITHVLRGEDHLTNTPRQLLILAALGRTAPTYGHVSLLVGPDNVPLSKRHGATSLRELREQGYTAQAILNHLFRLGHSTPVHGLLSLQEMARAFDPGHLQRAPAHFDLQQLGSWQKDSVHRMGIEQACDWIAGELPGTLSREQALQFTAAVLPNLVLPADARAWAQVVYGPPPPLQDEQLSIIAAAGPQLFAAAARAARQYGNDFARITQAVRETTGRKGADLFKPLRLAFTGQLEGPELKLLLAAMPAGAAFERVARFAGTSFE